MKRVTCKECGLVVHWPRYRDGSAILIGGKCYGWCECASRTWVHDAARVALVEHEARP